MKPAAFSQPDMIANEKIDTPRSKIAWIVFATSSFASITFSTSASSGNLPKVYFLSPSFHVRLNSPFCGEEREEAAQFT